MLRRVESILRRLEAETRAQTSAATAADTATAATTAATTDAADEEGDGPAAAGTAGSGIRFVPLT
jgi:hypothetical protein